VDEVVELRSAFGFLAIHGGSLERMTAEIATAAAEQSGSSLYAVLQPEDLRWHVPSARFDPAHSNALTTFLDHVHVAIAVHGYGREGMWTSLLLGGSNRVLADHLARHLRPRLDHYTVVDEHGDVPSRLRGLHPANPVNLAPGGGVQLELPPRVRGMGPYWHDKPFEAWSPHTLALIDGLARAAESWNAGSPGGNGQQYP
jgi:phage replication-related protein YjqB (UPF0714/DUF867 family)